MLSSLSIEFCIDTGGVYFRTGAGIFIAAVILGAIISAVVLIKRRNRPIEQIIGLAGFEYDSLQDIFVSKMDCWQRDFGYCEFYDEAAARLSMIIDCEPIVFEYLGKKWLIEFWKGQYGLTCGCEVGIYAANDKTWALPELFFDDFFEKIDDSEMMQISFTLLKDGEPAFSRSGIHWWLTGFSLGMFSPPNELTMLASITFYNREMRDAFLDALIEKGYTRSKLRVLGNTVRVEFSNPYSQQPSTRTQENDEKTLAMLKKLCDDFNEITGEDTGAEEKLAKVRKKNPKLYKQAISFGRGKKSYTAYKKIKKLL